MKEILVQFAAYNLWANQRLIKLINTIEAGLTEQEIYSSFVSIKLTLRHIKDVEWIWWQRMKLVESVIVDEKDQSVEEVLKELVNYSQLWLEWVEKSTVVAFEHEFVYRNTKKEQFKQPIFQMLLHLFNHQTYHRGQLVTMLRQVGVTKIPATDFIEWCRNH